jgi:nucleoid DNA-binding protein
MNKSDLIEALGKETGLTKGKAEQVVGGGPQKLDSVLSSESLQKERR